MKPIATMILAAGSVPLAMILIGADRPAALSQTQPGLWEISGAPGNSAPVRQCVAEVAALGRFEHRASACSSKISRDARTSTAIDYSCGGAGFGHSDIDVITPRSLRISTQGISAGLPFNYVLEARRVDDCPKGSSPNRH